MKTMSKKPFGVAERLEEVGGFLSAERMRQSAIAEVQGNWTNVLGKISEAADAVKPHWAGSNVELWKHVLRAEFLDAVARAIVAGWEDEENRIEEEWSKSF